MDNSIEERTTRSGSLESIPEVEFLKEMLEEDIRETEMEFISEFKRKEKNGFLIPEPLLIEDKARFVLFPIKHTDVRSNYFKFLNLNLPLILLYRYGICTRKPRLHSGLRKRLI